MRAGAAALVAIDHYGKPPEVLAGRSE
jgi:hypothetical protein